MSEAIQLREKLYAVRDILRKQSMAQLVSILEPLGMSPDRHIAIACNVLAREPYLLTCTPVSLAQTIIKGAELGLDFAPALGQAYIVPFWNTRKQAKEAQLIPGYRGYIKLALESPRYSCIDTDIIRDGDAYAYSRGTSASLIHAPVIGSTTPVIAAYAVAHFTNAAAPPMVALVDAARLNAIRTEALSKITDKDARKQQYKRDNAPWSKHEAEMQKKTAVRRLAKLLDVSTRLSRAMALDEEWDRNQRVGGDRTEALKNKLRTEAQGAAPGDDVLDVEAEPLEDEVVP